MHNPVISEDMTQRVNEFMSSNDIKHSITFKDVLDHFKLNEDEFNELAHDTKKASTFATNQLQKAEKSLQSASEAYNNAKHQLNDGNIDMGSRATSFFSTQATYNAAVEQVNFAKALVFYTFERVAHLATNLTDKVHDKISDFSDQF